jgi:hypothetical protein
MTAYKMIGQTEILNVASELSLLQEDKQVVDSSEPRLALSLTVYENH